MSEIVGRITCPVCGETMQDLKVNKNNKLYCFCDNGCTFKFNSKNSRHLLAQLKSGKSINVEKIGYIRAITDTYTQEEKKISRKDWLSEELDI